MTQLHRAQALKLVSSFFNLTPGADLEWIQVQRFNRERKRKEKGKTKGCTCSWIFVSLLTLFVLQRLVTRLSFFEISTQLAYVTQIVKSNRGLLSSHTW